MQASHNLAHRSGERFGQPGKFGMSVLECQRQKDATGASHPTPLRLVALQPEVHSGANMPSEVMFLCSQKRNLLQIPLRLDNQRKVGAVDSIPCAAMNLIVLRPLPQFTSHIVNVRCTKPAHHRIVRHSRLKAADQTIIRLRTRPEPEQARSDADYATNANCHRYP